MGDSDRVFHSGDLLDPKVTQAIYSLWHDAGVRQCFERSREFQLNDSAQ